MEKRIWNQPELELQVFAADEYVAVCDNKSWSAKGCVGNVPEGSSDFAWFTNNKTAKSYVDDGYFTYAEFQKTVEDDVWERHECGNSSNNPANPVLYMMDSWMTQIKVIINSGVEMDTNIDDGLWGKGQHAGGSLSGHVYDEVFYESHS